MADNKNTKKGNETKKSKNVGELLVVNKLISQAQLVEAMDYQRSHGGRLSKAIIKKGFIDETTLTKFIGKSYNMTLVNLDNYEIGEKLTRIVPETLARKHNVIPINEIGQTLVIAIADPTNVSVLEELRFYTKRKIKPVLAGEFAISRAIDRSYLVTNKMTDILKEIKIPKEDIQVELSSRKTIDITKDQNNAVIKFVNAMILEALKLGASDIHVEPYQHSLRVRYRLDGVLYEQVRPPVELKYQLISRLKIMAELDIAEKRLPQDGRFKVLISDGREIEFRVSTTPCLFGEKIVLRVIDDSKLETDMTRLGLEVEALEIFKRSIKKPKGMVLVTGPTGSGKTQTLYSALMDLNSHGLNISTAEDPVEFNLEGINQVWTKEDIGLTFAECLRSFMRQDPDIIMIGEIRDLETAEVSIKAALTGHLVFSTLHTNDAPSTINRLLNMGVEAYNLIASLNVVVAQRLARRICSKCKEETKFSPADLIKVGVPPEVISSVRTFKGRGCSYCGHTGYKGRIGIFEILDFTEDIGELVLKGSSTDEIRNEAIRLGMQTLRKDAVKKFINGVIDVDEILRVTTRD